LSAAFAHNAILRPKSTTRGLNAATASKDTRKSQGKAAMEFVPLSAVKIKIGLERDASASQDIT
jgi:hypothetical protein